MRLSLAARRQAARSARAARAAALGLVAATSPSMLAAQQAWRPAVAGTEAAVSSDHVLASAAGADVLRRGGNAVDAAITMAGVLAVVRPHMNGVGGDAFMLYYDAKTKQVYALNGSGRAGSRATPALFAQKNLRAVPSTGVLSVSVPGAVAAWSDALTRFGTITLASALAPGIRYAEQGFPVSTRLAADFSESARIIAGDAELARTFMPGGKLPEPGTLLREPDLAATLRAIASGGPDALYKGPIASRIATFMKAEDGLLTADDLAAHTSTWTEPISTTYRGSTVLAFPPNTQGVTLLELLNVASLFDLAAMKHNSADYVNTLVSAGKLAYADRDRYLADPAFANVDVARLLSAGRARAIADAVRARGAITVPPSIGADHDGSGDTVYLCVVDKDGNAVSYIQSLFAAFGSGRMVPGTGIILHNRGSLYELDPSHPNVIAPGKRPFHTLSPAMVLNPDRTLSMVIGSPGGDGQPQTILQVLNNIMVFGMTPQVAIEAPRWRAFQTARLLIETGMGDAVRAALGAKGHQVTVQEPSAEFGGAQLIMIHPVSKARIAAADFRREAYAIAW